MDRPVTSKPRGVCRYYNTPRGCYAGDSCKFLHGLEEKLTPYDKSKVCRYFVQGHCTRGERCWFRHELQKIPLDDELKNFDENMCNICLEKPKSYGLLSGCSHVFCLQCIRQWREPQGKSSGMVTSGILKRCPLCRAPSRFISPSTHFFPQDHPRKQVVIDSYKNSMARVPCKYFIETSASGKPCCPFGADCFYRHANPDGTPHVFQYGADHFMKVFKKRRRRQGHDPFGTISDTEFIDHLMVLQGIIGDPTYSLRVALSFFRRHLPAIWNNLDGESNTVTDTAEGEGIHEERQVLELFAESIAAERSLDATLPAALPADTSDAEERSLHSPVRSPISVPTVSLPPRTWSISPDTGLPASPREQARPSSSADVSAPLLPGFFPWATPRTPSPRPSSISPTSMTPTPSIQQSHSSRFSTMMNTGGWETMVIDISDEEDEEDEADEESVSPYLPNTGNDDEDSSGNGVTPSSTATVSHLPEPPPSEAAETPASSAGEQTAHPGRPQCEHDKDPPFVTDGRGRVVWSRTARGSQAQVDRERCRPSPAVKVRQTSENGVFVTDGRGCVVSIGQEASEVAGKIGDTETEVEAEAE